jgi:hypothetical protein
MEADRTTPLLPPLHLLSADVEQAVLVAAARRSLGPRSTLIRTNPTARECYGFLVWLQNGVTESATG